jgi:hypothetical protein
MTGPPPKKQRLADDGRGPDSSGCDSSDDDDGALEELARALALDRSGRLAGVRGLDYSAVSYRRFLGGPETVAQVKADCLLVDSRAKQLDDTFWLPHDAVPRFGLERLAKAVFDHHTSAGGVSYPSAKSGAEWWVQVRRGTVGGTGAAGGQGGGRRCRSRGADGDRLPLGHGPRGERTGVHSLTLRRMKRLFPTSTLVRICCRSCAPTASDCTHTSRRSRT